MVLGESERRVRDDYPDQRRILLVGDGVRVRPHPSSTPVDTSRRTFGLAPVRRPMTKRQVVTVAALIVLTLAGPALSAHERFRFVGTIVRMDTAKKLLIMKTGRKEHPPELEIGITEQTKVEKDGRKLPSIELKPGRYVVVDALGDDLLDTDATLIKIVPAPAKPPV